MVSDVREAAATAVIMLDDAPPSPCVAALHAKFPRGLHLPPNHSEDTPRTNFSASTARDHRVHAAACARGAREGVARQGPHPHERGRGGVAVGLLHDGRAQPAHAQHLRLALRHGVQFNAVCASYDAPLI